MYFGCLKEKSENFKSMEGGVNHGHVKGVSKIRLIKNPEFVSSFTQKFFKDTIGFIFPLKWVSKMNMAF